MAMLTAVGTISDVLCLSISCRNADGVVLPPLCSASSASIGARPGVTQTTCGLHNWGLIFLDSKTDVKITPRKVACIIKGKLQNTGFKTALSSRREHSIQGRGVNICVKISASRMIKS